MTGDNDAARVDRWLWAIRLFSTRTESTDACHGGHVRINGRPAKAATRVAVHDRVEARVHSRDRVVEVVRIIDKRVSAPVAAECYIDYSPPVADEDRDGWAVAARAPGTGRPTKRDRRRLDRYRAG